MTAVTCLLQPVWEVGSWITNHGFKLWLPALQSSDDEDDEEGDNNDDDDDVDGDDDNETSFEEFDFVWLPNPMEPNDIIGFDWGWLSKHFIWFDW